MDLIIDTSSEKLKVILNDKSSFLENESTNPKHLEHLLPQIDKLLLQKNIDLSSIKNFCVVVGPGSFTGVRIGVSTIKAFSNVYKKVKLVPINMLDMLKSKIIKMGLNSNKSFCIAIKSTSTKFYVLYENQDKTKNFSKMLLKEELSNLVNNKDTNFYSYLDEFVLEGKTSVKIDLDSKDYIEYVDFLKKQKKYVKENDLKPIYMALSQAEEELVKKENLKNA